MPIASQNVVEIALLTKGNAKEGVSEWNQAMKSAGLVQENILAPLSLAA